MPLTISMADRGAQVTALAEFMAAHPGDKVQSIWHPQFDSLLAHVAGSEGYTRINLDGAVEGISGSEGDALWAAIAGAA